jgi:hypothetical protein
MNSQLSKTIRFISGVCAMSSYVTRDSLFRNPSLNSPVMMSLDVRDV